MVESTPSILGGSCGSCLLIQMNESQSSVLSGFFSSLDRPIILIRKVSSFLYFIDDIVLMCYRRLGLFALWEGLKNEKSNKSVFLSSLFSKFF